jgi:hypothetical protein
MIELSENLRANPGVSERVRNQSFLALARKKNQDRPTGFLRRRGCRL